MTPYASGQLRVCTTDLIRVYDITGLMNDMLRIDRHNVFLVLEANTLAGPFRTPCAFVLTSYGAGFVVDISNKFSEVLR